MSELTLSVTDVSRLLGIGKASVYRAVREGRIAALRVGTKPKLRVPRAVIDRLLADPAEFNREGEAER